MHKLAVETLLKIPIHNATIFGDLCIPPNFNNSCVIFAHGSGSSRFSSRNKMVASELRKSGVATLLCDLLTPEEESVDQYTAEHRFNIPMLGNRVGEICDWMAQHSDYGLWSIGLFGASTGSAAALIGSIGRPHVKAVVSRGGRPDLVGKRLIDVETPTLLLVGGHPSEHDVVIMNQNAFKQMPSCTNKEIKIIPGATHLFEERGKLEEVAALAKDWFSKYLVNLAHD